MGIHKIKGGMRFRDLESLNTALLAKQAWRFLQFPNYLAATIFRESILRLNTIWMLIWVITHL